MVVKLAQDRLAQRLNIMRQTKVDFDRITLEHKKRIKVLEQEIDANSSSNLDLVEHGHTLSKLVKSELESINDSYESSGKVAYEKVFLEKAQKRKR